MEKHNIIPHRKYVIVAESERGFWQNHDGWVFNIEDATVFSGSEILDPLFTSPYVPAHDESFICVDYVFD